MTHFCHLTLLLVLCSLNETASEVYYITPTSTDLCTVRVRPCLTLLQFTTNSRRYLHSNTTLVFLPGTHYLSTVNQTLSNMDNFVMMSENSTAKIKCARYSNIHFSDSQCVHIANLEFVGCGGNQVKHVEEFVVQDTQFKGQESSETALTLIETTAEIVNSTFVFNRKGTYRKCPDPKFGCSSDGFIGGAIIATNSTIVISQNKFECNGADIGGAIFAEQNSVIIMSDNVVINNSANQCGGALHSSSSLIIIEESQFLNNSATDGGGVLDSSSSTLKIAASKFIGNSATNGGVLHSSSSTSIIKLSEFQHNSATFGGGVLLSINDTMTIEACKFHNNSVSAGDGGGVLHSSFSITITIKASEFHNNSVTNDGGVLYLFFSYNNIIIEACGFYNNSASMGGVANYVSSFITIERSKFQHNSVTGYGGVLYSNGEPSTITIERSKFLHNCAAISGGVLSSSSYITITIINESEFHDNNAFTGGVLEISNSIITIEASEFHNNSATILGGVLLSNLETTTIIGSSNFTKNHSPIGAVIFALDSSIQHHNYLVIANNSADDYAVIYLADSEFGGRGSESITFLSNLGSLVAFNSNITFIGYAIFMNNGPPQTTTDDLQEGGAITLFLSNAFFDGKCNFEHNHAESGGAIYSSGSNLYVTGDVIIAHNTATGNGGGVHLSTSELNCRQMSTFILINNTAINNGGGLNAIGSSIRATSNLYYGNSEQPYIGTRIKFTHNSAKMGGGLSLDAGAKLFILKYDGGSSDFYNYDTNATIFIANQANYGGAVYVDDDANSGTCASNKKSECFIQVLAVHNRINDDLKIPSLYFTQNQAKFSGSTLYGGLLDRCAVSRLAEVHKKHYPEYKGNGVSYFKDISTGENTLISSDPVQVCPCIDNEHNCILERYYVEVKKGGPFTVSLVAVDQIGQPVNATIKSSLQFDESGIAEGQLAKKIHKGCTDLTFNVVSPHDSETITLFASDGPCKDVDLSKKTIRIHFLPCSCPIGLQILGMTNCTCECHSDINQYVEKCDSHTGLLIKQPQSRAWISYINDTNLTGYLIYPNCPFDYCLSTSPPVDLNQPNGADAQCAFNRSSLLCGSCQPGLSLSLGSSRCLPCPSHWPALLIAITIAAILIGLALVALLLVLNMTVAVGTLNGLIFYANVVYANKSILLPFQETNFITLFISWLNLELGIDTCYFPGMDTYIKTWLQLAFPAYVILLVVLVIIISSYSSKFSNLIGKKNPVATLSTLILLSYAKLLEICFKSLSVGVFEYPDKHSSELLWLPDATVKYLSGKHIPLFITSIFILLVGLVYTALLFSWQWLLYLPRWRIFRWSRNPKIQTFIETYHVPYTPKYRFWTGLLLIVRVVLYLVSAVNVSNDPTVALTAISFTVCCIFTLR